MPLRQSPRRALLRPPRRQSRSASRYRSAELIARGARASDNKSPLLARYGQNNLAIALGRKNHLFAGSDEGGRHWAVHASLIETAKMNDLDPQTYIADVLAKIANRHPISRIDELLPWAYAKAAAERQVA
jgi:hypothetical protein